MDKQISLEQISKFSEEYNKNRNKGNYNANSGI